MKSRISNYPVATFNKLPKDIRDKVKKIQEKSGFIPNVFLALGHRPDELRAFFNYHDVIMERNSNLTKAEKEMIVVATSSANSCLYCVVSHGAILRVYEKHSFISEILLQITLIQIYYPRSKKKCLIIHYFFVVIQKK